jgi:hypothetical protein
MIVRQMRGMIGKRAWAEGADKNGDGSEVRGMGLDNGIQGSTVFGEWTASFMRKRCWVFIKQGLTVGR